MRLFIAVNTHDETKKRLMSIQSGIQKQAPKGNYSRPENLHLTLVFLGETPPEQVPSICSVMQTACQACPSFCLEFGSTGFFRHSGKELWWIGCDPASPNLRHIEKLRHDLCDGLRAAGVKFDERPFKPHITLGREIKPCQPINVTAENISFPVNRISLMRSERRNGLLVYTEIGYSACAAADVRN